MNEKENQNLTAISDRDRLLPPRHAALVFLVMLESVRLIRREDLQVGVFLVPFWNCGLSAP